MKRIVLIQGSLRKHSRTAVVVREAAAALKKKKVPHAVIDLRDLKLEFCDGRDLEEYGKDLRAAHAAIAKADAIIVGMPVYCYSVSGPLKNFFDIVSDAFEGKPVGILCNSGGIRSSMASSHLMTILAFECHCSTVQPAVHTWSEDFANGVLTNDDVRKRLDAMIKALLHAVR
ncbi:MAG: FMN reductase [Candidatus Peregrinibacteria bacterium Gr01-1014_25]|nr:MAG: FMN reductase [Candidatus Peregrinibacteria bacterium Gr01-1014_25]